MHKDADHLKLSYSIVFLAIVSLSSILCFTDAGIEANPGPVTKSHTNFKYKSEGEKRCFLELREQNKSLLKIPAIETS